MLPTQFRMRRGEHFRLAVRGGRRCGRRTLVVHVARNPASTGNLADRPLVGFVVGKAVGGSVVRSQVKRRLRTLMRERLDMMPEGLLVVVRANPAAASADRAEVARDLDAALRRVLAAPSTPGPAATGRGARG